MTYLSSQNIHSTDEEVMAAHAAGTLPTGQHLVLSCQADLRPEIAQKLATCDAVGGALIETAKSEDLSDAFIGRLMDALNNETETEVPAKREAPTWMPAALAEYLDRADIELKWRSVGSGVQHAPIVTSKTGERIYLLRAEPGTKMPVHSHSGEEWTLILQGGYHVGDTGYVRGDLHCEDEACEHQPIIDDHGEACISLVADQGRLKFRNPLLKLFQLVTRV